MRPFFLLFIFREPISSKIPLEQYFEEYTGGPDADEATEYIMLRFVQANRAGLTVYAQ